MSKNKRSFVIGGAILAVIAVVYFSFFYPPVAEEDAKGTVGGVKKYRAEQITEEDVVLEGKETTPPSETEKTLSSDQPTLEMQEITSGMAGVLDAVGKVKLEKEGDNAVATAQASLAAYVRALKSPATRNAKAERARALGAVEANVSVVARRLATYRGARHQAVMAAKTSLEGGLAILAKIERKGHVNRAHIAAAAQSMASARAALRKEGKVGGRSAIQE